MSTPDAISPTAAPRAPELEPILAHLNAGPSRTWSLIVTVFGDSIVPRGGAIWLGTLLEIFRSLDIGDGVVRTAMSRLTADGWLVRSKAGRNSFYRLAAEGQAAFARATNKIYTRRPPVWIGHFDALFTEQARSQDDAVRLQEAGYGSPSPGCWIIPGEATPTAPDGAVHVTIAGTAAEVRQLAARAWELGVTADSYHRFIAVFEPLGATLDAGLRLSERDAFLARMLLIHAYRRIVLRDPLLPPDVLAPDWPGTRARALCAAIYRCLLAGSEAWLDANAIGEDNAALKANPDAVGARFRD